VKQKQFKIASRIPNLN